MKRRKYLLILIGLLGMMQIHAQKSVTFKMGDEAPQPQWIGAITDEDAHIPSNRDYVGTGTVNAKGKPDWKATAPLSRQSIWLKKEMKLPADVHKAMMKIVGLGFYELSINQQKVTDAVFAPLWSDYDKTIFYNTYDVTALLRKGKNQLTVLLGNGFYNEQGGRYAKMKVSYGPPTLYCSLEIELKNGRTVCIVSDGSWKYSPSSITFNSIYGGEDEDARIMPFWKPVVIQKKPRGILRQQMAQPVKMMEYFGVKSRHQLTPQQIAKASNAKHPIPAGTFVLDMGQNLAGFPQIKVSGKAGQQVRLYLSETLTAQGTCNQKQSGSPYYLTYTLSGKGEKSADGKRIETWHPHFTYYGYRYIQVEGAVMKGDENPDGKPVIEDIQSCFVYNSAAKIGNFECSNPMFNRAYQVIDRAIRSNWQAVWTDCPHREKLGWLEQDWLNGEGLVYNYDCRSMIEQTMQNIADAQHANGAVPTTAPEYIYFKGKWLDPFAESPEWGGALVALPFLYLQHYGDDRMVKKYAPQMFRYVDYLQSKDSCRILKQGLGDWYDYGKGRSGFSQNTPMPLVATAHYYLWVKLTQKAAAMSGKTAEANRYAILASEILQSFQKEFLHVEKAASSGKSSSDAVVKDAIEKVYYGSGSQASNAIPLALGMVPSQYRKQVLQHLVDDIHAHHDRLTTGDVGNRYLFQTLLGNGYADLWYKMLAHDDVPGYGFQIKKGMTTLTEQWNPEMGASMNHFMMAHINNHFLPDIVGIRIEQGRLIIAPQPIGDLTWAKGSTRLSNGKLIAVAWKKLTDDKIEVTVDTDNDVEYEIKIDYDETEHNDGTYRGKYVFVGKCAK